MQILHKDLAVLLGLSDVALSAAVRTYRWPSEKGPKGKVYDLARIVRWAFSGAKEAHMVAKGVVGREKLQKRLKTIEETMLTGADPVDETEVPPDLGLDDLSEDAVDSNLAAMKDHYTAAYRREQTLKTEMENRVRAGELLEVRPLREALTSICFEFRNAIEALERDDGAAGRKAALIVREWIERTMAATSASASASASEGAP